jgi:hypothetical protein
MNRRSAVAAAGAIAVGIVAFALNAGSDESPKAIDDPNPITFADRTAESAMLEPVNGMMGHGAAWGDFDGDGRFDLYVGGFCDRPNAEYKPADGPVPNRLFRNLGDGRFELVEQPTVSFHGRTSGAVFADLDNNGTLELYVANNALARSRHTDEPQRSAQLRHANLFRNDLGKLVDISAESGACPDSLHTARNIGVFDYDGDGLLDLFVVEDKFVRGAGGPRSVLLRNLGGLKFEDANAAAGLPDDILGLGLAVADLNADDRPDIFVAHSDRLFLSQPGGKYGEAVELRDVFKYQPMDGEDWPCGAAFGDLNRDGRLDLVVTAHHAPARNRVFMNLGSDPSGAPQFREVSAKVGLGDRVPVKCPHVEIQDFDNDGWPDIYTSAAWLDGDRVTPLVFRNLGVRDGLPRFQRPRPIEPPMVYFPAGPSADYDEDGRIDLFLVNWFAGNHSRLLHNECPKRNWLKVEVSGTASNRMGIGSKVAIQDTALGKRPNMIIGYQEIATGYGYASGQPAVCHFGLGDISSVNVTVRLPNGKTIFRGRVAANQTIVFGETDN